MANISKIVKKLVHKYITDSEVVMGEFLASEKVQRGLTYEQAFEIYISCMKIVEEDKFYTIKENKTIEL